uniref:PGG domain-containing protein n=1 Tax=Vitis vinifera TaxID=29760 RepID=F6HRA0_VITVI
MHLTKPLNKDNQTAEELFAARNERLHRDAKEWLMRTTENCTILSIFIATVAFAAAYTVPGGPNQDTGIPILNSKPFFVVFILADVFSLTLALTSVGIFLSILTSSFPLQDFKTYLFKKLTQGITCMIAVAFGATIVLIMTHNWKNAVWGVVGFLLSPFFSLIFTSTFSNPGTLHRIFQKFCCKIP